MVWYLHLSLYYSILLNCIYHLWWINDNQSNQQANVRYLLWFETTDLRPCCSIVHNRLRLKLARHQCLQNVLKSYRNHRSNTTNIITDDSAFSSADWAIHISGQNAVCVCVCLDVNQGCTNHNRCTQRLVILTTQTY